MANFKTVQLKPEDIELIREISKELEEKLGTQFSDRATILYALKQLERA